MHIPEHVGGVTKRLGKSLSCFRVPQKVVEITRKFVLVIPSTTCDNFDLFLVSFEHH